MISVFTLRSHKQSHQHSWHDKYIAHTYLYEQSRSNFSQFSSQLKTRWRFWGSQTMYMWYFNGLFPPPQKKLVAKRQKRECSVSLFCPFLPPHWCRRWNSKFPLYKTKTAIFSFHTYRQGPFSATIRQWDTEKGIFLALNKGWWVKHYLQGEMCSLLWIICKSLPSVNARSASIHTSNSSSASICSCNIGILFSSFSGAIVLITPSALQEGIQIRSHAVSSLSSPKLIWCLKFMLEAPITHFKPFQKPSQILLLLMSSWELAWKILHPATLPDSRWGKVLC